MYFLNKNINMINYFILMDVNLRTTVFCFFFILYVAYTNISQDHVAFRVANTLIIVISFFDHWHLLDINSGKIWTHFFLICQGVAFTYIYTGPKARVSAGVMSKSQTFCRDVRV